MQKTITHLSISIKPKNLGFKGSLARKIKKVSKKGQKIETLIFPRDVFFVLQKIWAQSETQRSILQRAP